VGIVLETGFRFFWYGGNGAQGGFEEEDHLPLRMLLARRENEGQNGFVFFDVHIS